MAYNPFNIFRRNQKALFAVLTVFIMIMFTLSFGSGDALERFTKWLGGRGKGETVCKIDGDSIKDSELSKVRRQRVMANTFMALASDQAWRTADEFANQQQSRLSDEGKQTAGMVDVCKRLLAQVRGNPQLLDTPVPDFGNRTPRQIIGVTDGRLASMIEKGKSEDREAARAYRAMLEILGRRAGMEDNHFFVNAPNRSTRDTIEFLLWEKKADQLGITFTADDVKTLLGREFYGFWTARGDIEVQKDMRKQEGYNTDACLKALALEFKVRAAQAAVLGHPDPRNPRRIGPPLFSAPYEMFEYYREQCSPATYELIAVPAAAFLDKVPREPSDGELKELYDKYASDEPNPGKETFGFKEPRKLAIGWLALTGEEPYYQKLATEQVKIGEVAAKGSGLLTIPLPGAGGGWAGAAVAPLALKEPAVDAAYSKYKTQFTDQLHNNFGGGAYDRATMFPHNLQPTSTVRPGTLASVLGGMAGQSGPFGSPAVAVSIAASAPIAYEIRDRIKTGLPLVLGAVPGPGLFQNAVGGVAGYTLAAPQPLSIEAMRPELLKSTISDRAKALAHGSRPNFIDPTATPEPGDLTRFTEELQKLSDKGKPKDKAAVEKYIKEFLAARGLTKEGEQFGFSTAPRDEWTLEEDRGLLPLVVAQKDGLARAAGPHGGDRYVPFGRSFFWRLTRDEGGTRRVATSGTYLATPFVSEDRGQSETGRARYVYWVTEDVAPKKTNLITAKEAVRAAWKQIEARKLAAARAEEIAAAIRNNPKSDPALIPAVVSEEAYKFRGQISVNNSKAFYRARTFPMDKVCPLVPIDLSGIGQEVLMQLIQSGRSLNGLLQPFGLTETDNIPYPTRDMEAQLLANRDKPAKTVLVLPDAPKDTYYVATLVRPSTDPLSQKSASEFKQNVYALNGPAQGVLRDFAFETARKARQSVVELLKKEFKYVETEEQKKKLDENAKSGGRD